MKKKKAISIAIMPPQMGAMILRRMPAMMSEKCSLQAHQNLLTFHDHHLRLRVLLRYPELESLPHTILTTQGTSSQLILTGRTLHSRTMFKLLKDHLFNVRCGRHQVLKPWVHHRLSLAPPAMPVVRAGSRFRTMRKSSGTATFSSSGRKAASGSGRSCGWSSDRRTWPSTKTRTNMPLNSSFHCRTSSTLWRSTLFQEANRIACKSSPRIRHSAAVVPLKMHSPNGWARSKVNLRDDERPERIPRLEYGLKHRVTLSVYVCHPSAFHRPPQRFLTKPLRLYSPRATNIVN